MATRPDAAALHIIMNLLLDGFSERDRAEALGCVCAEFLVEVIDREGADSVNAVVNGHNAYIAEKVAIQLGIVLEIE